MAVPKRAAFILERTAEILYRASCEPGTANEIYQYEEMSLLFRCEPFAYFIKSMADKIVLNDDIPIWEQITLDRATAVHTITGPAIIRLRTTVHLIYNRL